MFSNDDRRLDGLRGGRQYVFVAATMPRDSKKAVGTIIAKVSLATSQSPHVYVSA